MSIKKAKIVEIHLATIIWNGKYKTVMILLGEINI